MVKMLPIGGKNDSNEAEMLNVERFHRQIDRLVAATYASGSRPITDLTDEAVPGSKVLVGGDVDAGIYGFVQPSEFGLINEATPFSNDNLRTIIGVGGTNEYGDPPWMKYSFGGKILFVPLKPLSRSVSWDAIYNAGCVYGVDGPGTLPPAGRLGSELTIEDIGDGTIGITTTGHFLGDMSGGMGYYDTVGGAGDTIVLSGWSNTENNGEFEIATITDSEITVVGGGLVPEEGTMSKKLWNKSKEVNQLKVVNLNGYDYKVRLLKGAASDPAEYGNNRGARGLANEWVRLIMSSHIKALTGDWDYSYHDPIHVTDFGVGLTDEDLITHHTYGLGSYTWVQETRGDNETFRRLHWGNNGASFVFAFHSWFTYSTVGFRPVLELLG